MPKTESVRDDRESPTLVGAVRNGVWSGLKWPTIIVGPFFLFGVFLQLITMFRFLFLDDTRVLDNVSEVTISPVLLIFSAYFLFCCYGIIIGVSLSLVRFFRPED